MKFEVELDDELVKKVEETYKMDAQVLLQAFASEVFKGLLEGATLLQAGVPITDEMIKKYGRDIGHRLFQKSKKKEGAPCQK